MTDKYLSDRRKSKEVFNSFVNVLIAGPLLLTLYFAKLQNGQTHFKNLAASAARF